MLYAIYDRCRSDHGMCFWWKLTSRKYLLIICDVRCERANKHWYSFWLESLQGVWSVLLWVELQNDLILANTVVFLYIHLLDLVCVCVCVSMCVCLCTNMHVPWMSYISTLPPCISLLCKLMYMYIYCSLAKESPLMKELSPPTFGPISRIRSKFTRMSKLHMEFEKHALKTLCISEVTSCNTYYFTKGYYKASLHIDGHS